MTEHALQAAYFAREESAPVELVVAALLHDIGHLVEKVPDDLGDWTSDARHEEIGARWLEQRMRPEVAGPVRLHVPAKRYLCATDRSYVAMLSQASIITLQLQGGPMTGPRVVTIRNRAVLAGSGAAAALGRSGKGCRVEDTRAGRVS